MSHRRMRQIMWTARIEGAAWALAAVVLAYGILLAYGFHPAQQTPPNLPAGRHGRRVYPARSAPARPRAQPSTGPARAAGTIDA